MVDPVVTPATTLQRVPPSAPSSPDSEFEPRKCMPCGGGVGVWAADGAGGGWMCDVLPRPAPLRFLPRPRYPSYSYFPAFPHHEPATQAHAVVIAGQASPPRNLEGGVARPLDQARQVGWRPPSPTRTTSAARTLTSGKPKSGPSRRCSARHHIPSQQRPALS